ncbi:Mss4-like protein [Baffinella frigidus]|nr:Mss4-like protein [Cryptophyta sp. CCMP2293]
MPACPDGHAGASPLRETSTSTARDRSPPRGRRGAPRRRRLPVLHGVLVTIASWSLLLCCAGLSAGAEPETDPARHTPRAGDISVTAGTFHGALQKAASAWGLTSGEGVSPGLQPDPVWEGGIDRLGVLGCHMGRAGGNCSSAGNCLRPPSADQAELCLSHGSMERTNTGKWAANHSKGVYTCACCNASLFLSRDKFDSARGHATFHKSVPNAVGYKHHEGTWWQHPEDTGIHCESCGAHLGNVRGDGPGEKGRRYTVNSPCVALHCDTPKCHPDKFHQTMSQAAQHNWRAMDSGSSFTVRVRRTVVMIVEMHTSSKAPVAAKHIIEGPGGC